MFLLRLLFRIALLLLLVYLLHRLWVFLTREVAEKGGLPPRHDPGEPLVRDPECHTQIPRSDALTATIEGRTVYFCSRECRDVYLARNRQLR